MSYLTESYYSAPVGYQAYDATTYYSLYEAPIAEYSYTYTKDSYAYTEGSYVYSGQDYAYAYTKDYNTTPKAYSYAEDDTYSYAKDSYSYA